MFILTGSIPWLVWKKPKQETLSDKETGKSQTSLNTPVQEPEKVLNIKEEKPLNDERLGMETAVFIELL